MNDRLWTSLAALAVMILCPLQVAIAQAIEWLFDEADRRMNET